MYAALSYLSCLWGLEEQREVGGFKVILWREAEGWGEHRVKGGGGFMGELTPQLFYQNYLPISASFGVKRVL